MSTRIGVIFAIAVVLTLSIPVDAEQPATDREERFQTLWQVAADLHSAEQYQDAEAAYRNILVEFPQSQRTALQIAICQEKSGKISEASESYEAAIAIEPLEFWAGVALFYKARMSRDQGNLQEADRCIGRLREFFPDSSYIARAALLEAEMAGQGILEAQGRLDRELEASEQYDKAMQASREGQEETALDLLEWVIVHYPDTAASLRALEAKGHIQARNKQFEEAIETFLQILEKVSPVAPQSRIALTAQTRLAALYHATLRREDALSVYLELLKSEGAPAFASNAALQSAGIVFELIQRQKWAGKVISDSRWEMLRSVCETVKQLESTTLEQKARADQMLLMSFSWQGKKEEAIAAAEAFIETYELPRFKQEVATARFFAGEDLQTLGRYREALKHFEWIVQAYEGEKEIWPQMDHLPRTYFRIWETLRQMGAGQSEIQKAAHDLLSQFPDAFYSEHVLIEIERERSRQDRE